MRPLSRTSVIVSLAALAMGACSHTSSSPPADGVTFADPPIPASAVAIGHAPSDRVLNLVLGLERDSEGLAQRVRDIATPGSPHYHVRQSVADTAAEFGATPDTIAAIVADLEKRGLPVEQNVAGAFLTARLTVAQAEDLFRTAIGTYRLGGRGTFLSPDGAPSAPATWNGVVREVFGLSTLPALDDVRDEEEEEESFRDDADGARLRHRRRGERQRVRIGRRFGIVHLLPPRRHDAGAVGELSRDVGVHDRRRRDEPCARREQRDRRLVGVERPAVERR